MSAATPSIERIPGYCALCVSRCGSIAVIENGRFTALEPNPAHPTGKAICAKGRAAPELVYHPDRLSYPLKRTRPKGARDPGWERISWDEALETVAAKLLEIRDENGAESVAFSIASPSTSASADSLDWIERLRRAFGSPNECMSMELCGWGRYGATVFTFGASVPGYYMPDIENAGCILFWGYNPNLARLTHAVSTTEALQRGAKLIVVDPRRTTVAAKADRWLRVRPGTDAALALAIANVMIQRGWYDSDFVREWTNGPLLVRDDDGLLLTEADILADGSGSRYVAWDENEGGPVIYDPSSVRYERDHPSLALFGRRSVSTLKGRINCRPAFDLIARTCQQYSPARAEDICGVERADIEATARTLWENRPVAYYAWSGVEMHTNSTQIARAIAQLYVLTGSFDCRGGNVLFGAVPAANVAGEEFLPPEKSRLALGATEYPLGPPSWEQINSADLYTAILERRPYAVRALVGFGANLLLSHSASLRGKQALTSLEFYVHADLFMNPTAELADIVLPVASAFECEALRIGFEGSSAASALVQLRHPVVTPRGEARSDIQIVFDLACRLGLGSHFWDGDIDAGYKFRLAPSGITLEGLRGDPNGVSVSVETRYRKFSQRDDGLPRGFRTPTRKIELYSETLLQHSYPPIPEHTEPMMSLISRPDLADRFPLVLTCAKHTLFCESQHRALPRLRRRARDPEVELHPDDAAARDVTEGDWVSIETPEGSVRARARLNDSLAPGVVCGQHGWWQACAELGLDGYDPFSSDGANFNLIIGNDWTDPVSGSVPHRSYLCEVRKAGS